MLELSTWHLNAPDTWNICIIRVNKNTKSKTNLSESVYTLTDLVKQVLLYSILISVKHLNFSDVM